VRQSAGERREPDELAGVERELILSLSGGEVLSSSEVDRGGVESIVGIDACKSLIELLRGGDDMMRWWYPRCSNHEWDGRSQLRKEPCKGGRIASACLSGDDK
jgi:hypothetical protein